MILATFLLAQAVAAPPPLTDADDEIVVLGRRLAETRADYATRLRNVVMTIRRCNVTHSSGDRQLYKIVCRAIRECVKHIPTDARNGDALPEFYACNQERSMAMARALFEKREQRR